MAEKNLGDICSISLLYSQSYRFVWICCFDLLNYVHYVSLYKDVHVDFYPIKILPHKNFPN